MLTALVLTLTAVPGAALAQAAPADPPIDAAERTAVITSLIGDLDKTYVLPELAKKMQAALRAHQARHDYDAFNAGGAFAARLTADLQALSHDKHLEIDFVAEGSPVDDGKAPSPAEAADYAMRVARVNFGFRKVERLDGATGLLDIGAFYPAPMIGPTAASAMGFLANSEAVIIDLRTNHGGDATGVQLLESWFFAGETHMLDQYDRAANRTREYWTLPFVPGTRLADRDVYILVGSETFSAGEAFAYGMQAQKRATVIGEPTAGAAHWTEPQRLSAHFVAQVPFSRSLDPVTGRNWEGVGVAPDVRVPAGQALATAHLLALRKAVARHKDDADWVATLNKAIAARTAELEAMKGKG
jgi:C-terminal processing protease CtpA/Prc